PQLPGGNVTGVSLLGYELDSKRLQLLRELLPRSSTIGVLMDANNPVITATFAANEGGGGGKWSAACCSGCPH
ncbi:MAG: hypothetical protein WA645_13540, partial [Pseudolabrys sp.]